MNTADFAANARRYYAALRFPDLSGNNPKVPESTRQALSAPIQGGNVAWGLALVLAAWRVIERGGADAELTELLKSSGAVELVQQIASIRMALPKSFMLFLDLGESADEGKNAAAASYFASTAADLNFVTRGALHNWLASKPFAKVAEELLRAAGAAPTAATKALPTPSPSQPPTPAPTSTPAPPPRAIKPDAGVATTASNGGVATVPRRPLRSGFDESDFESRPVRAQTATRPVAPLARTADQPSSRPAGRTDTEPRPKAIELVEKEVDLPSFVTAYLLSLGWPLADIERVLAGPDKSHLTAERFFRVLTAQPKEVRDSVVDRLERDGHLDNQHSDPLVVEDHDPTHLVAAKPQAVSDAGAVLAEFLALPAVQQQRFASLLAEYRKLPVSTTETPGKKGDAETPAKNEGGETPGKKGGESPGKKGDDLIIPGIKLGLDAAEKLIRELLGGSGGGSKGPKKPVKGGGSGTKDGGGKEDSDSGGQPSGDDTETGGSDSGDSEGRTNEDEQEDDGGDDSGKNGGDGSGDGSGDDSQGEEDDTTTSSDDQGEGGGNTDGDYPFPDAFEGLDLPGSSESEPD